MVYISTITMTKRVNFDRPFCVNMQKPGITQCLPWATWQKNARALKFTFHTYSLPSAALVFQTIHLRHTIF